MKRRLQSFGAHARQAINRWRPSRTAPAVLFVGVTLAACAQTRPSSSVTASARSEKSCFLLYELGVGEVRRAPSKACGDRLTPASTFKIPHALAALDSGVVSGPDVSFPYDQHPVPFATWRRDHTLATAMKCSVVWYFQKIAERLGLDREKKYLAKFGYGNATGEHPFATPWPEGTTVGAKTGSASYEDGQDVRWLVGNVRRARRSWVFVSTVVSSSSLAPLAAIDLASRRLKEEHVL